MKRRRPISLRRDFLLSPEGTVFLSGCFMLIAWIGTVVALWRFEHPRWSDMLTMGFAQTLAGRAAAIAQGTQVEINRGLLVLLATYADVLFVFLSYPLLIFSYRNMVEGRYFQKQMRSVLASAEKSSERFAKYSIASVFLFVWLPFHMTGVLVGAVIGYLLGLRTWVNMATVTLATMTASICWVFAYEKLYGYLGAFHSNIPFYVTALIIGGLVVHQWIKRRRNDAAQATVDQEREKSRKS